MSESSQDWLLQFFKPEPSIARNPEVILAEGFYTLALLLCRALPANPERTTALRKLLESKDCAVRAKLAGVKT